jgi:predicted dehydrogenase
VLITAGASVLATLALSALEAGKHVLVEKPLPRPCRGASVADAAATRNRVLMVSQNYRFFPAPWAVRALVTEGAIGEVGSVYADFRVDMARRLRAGSGYFALPDPLLLDMSIHHFDLLRFTLGRGDRGELLELEPSRQPLHAPGGGERTCVYAAGVVSYRGAGWAAQPPTGGSSGG